MPSGVLHGELFLLHHFRLLPLSAEEGHLSTEHHIGRNAQTPYIAGLGIARVEKRARLQHFGGTIPGSAHDGLEPPIPKMEGQPPVNEFDPSAGWILVHKDHVLRFDVPMSDPILVRIAQGAARLFDDVSDLRLSKGVLLLLVHGIKHIFAWTQLHDEGHQPTLPVHFKQSANVLVMELHHGLGLVLKGLCLLPVRDQHLLHGHLAIRLFPILSLPDGSKRTSANLLEKEKAAGHVTWILHAMRPQPCRGHEGPQGCYFEALVQQKPFSFRDVFGSKNVQKSSSKSSVLGQLIVLQNLIIEPKRAGGHRDHGQWLLRR